FEYVRKQCAVARDAITKPKAEKPRPGPKYLDKLTLARSAPPSVLASRPDLRAALEAAEVGQ
ncbi:MAG TPA: hypothetical protein VMH92_05645, partial [Acidocella sp.]|nr:hypothetical protein [Acidocella sp.]